MKAKKPSAEQRKMEKQIEHNTDVLKRAKPGDALRTMGSYGWDMVVVAIEDDYVYAWRVGYEMRRTRIRRDQLVRHYGKLSLMPGRTR